MADRYRPPANVEQPAQGAGQDRRPGPWSDICRFNVDLTAPNAAPVVSSKDYKTTANGIKSGETEEYVDVAEAAAK